MGICGLLYPSGTNNMEKSIELFHSNGQNYFKIMQDTFVTLATIQPKPEAAAQDLSECYLDNFKAFLVEQQKGICTRPV